MRGNTGCPFPTRKSAVELRSAVTGRSREIGRNRLPDRLPRHIDAHVGQSVKYVCFPLWNGTGHFANIIAGVVRAAATGACMQVDLLVLEAFLSVK